jgi:ABC-type nitrate/sulfonate/bicarbonate transport system substrate-binding protein
MELCMKSYLKHIRLGCVALALGVLTISVLPARAEDKPVIRIGTQQGLSGATPLKFVKWIEDEGFKVEWITFQNAGASSTALVAGSIDMQAAGLAPEMALATKDSDIWLVGTSELNSSQLVVSPKSGITKIADLKGKTISTAGPGSQQYALLVAALKKEGLTVKDLRLISTPANTMPALLEKGSIDGFFAWPPFTSKSLESGSGKLLISATPEFHASIGGHGPWVGEGWEVNADFAKTHKDAVIAVLKAEIRYFKLLHDSPKDGYELMAKAANVTPEHVAYIIEHGYDGYPVDIAPDRAVIASMLKLIKEAGLVAQADQVNDEKFLTNFIHPEFAQEAAKANAASAK